MSERPKRPVFKPSQILRLIREKKMPASVKGGIYQCRHCNYVDLVAGTESPDFHENGMRHTCVSCNKIAIHNAIFPPCEGYPNGFEIDMMGERKQYPILDD